MKPGEIRLKKWDKDLGRYVEVTRKGKVYDLDGRNVELFPVRVLAEALDRTSQSIQRWHREKTLPPPMFKTPGENVNRVYSKWQIINVAHLYVTRYDRKNRYFDKEKFLSEVRAVWYKTEFLPEVENNS